MLSALISGVNITAVLIVFCIWTPETSEEIAWLQNLKTNTVLSVCDAR